MGIENFNLKKEEKNTCKHNTEISIFCENCLIEAQENQIAWNKIKDLIEGSKTKRKNLNPETTIEIGEEIFEIKQIKTKGDEKILDVVSLLEKHFKPEELNTTESFLEKIEGKNLDGTKRPAYRCFYIVDNLNNIIATRVSENIPLKNKEGFETDKNIFYGLYIAIEEKYRSLGMARELYISALIDSMIESQRENKKLSYLIAECTPRSEYLMNTIGLKKIFLKNQNNLKEFEYIQPTLEFNATTGQEEKQGAPEHLMLCNLQNSGDINKENFYEVLFSLYNQYQNSHTEKNFATREAFENYLKYYKDINKNAYSQIENSEILIALNIEEQKEYKEKGYNIIPFEEANNR